MCNEHHPGRQYTKPEHAPTCLVCFREAVEKERLAEAARQKAAVIAAAADRKRAADAEMRESQRAATEAAAKAKAGMEAEAKTRAAESERLKQVIIGTYNSSAVTNILKPHTKSSHM